MNCIYVNRQFNKIFDCDISTKFTRNQLLNATTSVNHLRITSVDKRKPLCVCEHTCICMCMHAHIYKLKRV